MNESILFKAKQVFDQYFISVNGFEYSWPKCKSGGKDWKGLKQFIERLRTAAEAKSKAPISDESLLELLNVFLELLPPWHKKNSLTPNLLYGRFNQIRTEIAQSNKRSTGLKGEHSAIKGYLKDPSRFA